MRILIMLFLANSFAYTFGYSGTRGRDGLKGENGQNGVNKTYFASEVLNQTINLSGTDGSDAGDATPGGDAYSCYFYGRPAYDVYGAPGGTGGMGGNGGDGGDGGDLTLYYNNQDDLKSINFISYGGRSGRGGYGASGGNGCYCPIRRWRNPYCPHYDCYPQFYYCHEGSIGRSGRDGHHGDNGRKGRLYLVKKENKLEKEILAKTVALGDQDFYLRKHFFKKATLDNYLGEGSNFSQESFEYDNTREEKISLRWENPRDPLEFVDLKADFSFYGKSVDFLLPSFVWHKTRKVGNTFYINKIVRKSEAMDIEFNKTRGSGNDLELIIDNSSMVNEYVKTKIHMLYKRRFALIYRTGFEGEIPSSAIRYEGRKIVIDIGQLPMKSVSYMKNGKKIWVKLKVTRSLNGFSSTKELQFKGRI